MAFQFCSQDNPSSFSQSQLYCADLAKHNVNCCQISWWPPGTQTLSRGTQTMFITYSHTGPALVCDKPTTRNFLLMQYNDSNLQYTLANGNKTPAAADTSMPMFVAMVARVCNLCSLSILSYPTVLYSLLLVHDELCNQHAKCNRLPTYQYHWRPSGCARGSNLIWSSHHVCVWTFTVRSDRKMILGASVPTQRYSSRELHIPPCHVCS